MRNIAPDLWVAEQGDQRFLGLHLGTRMTVVRLSRGGLLLHSPIRPTVQLRSALDALGEVQQIIAPSLYHHVYAGDFSRAYPQAILHGPPGLVRKRRDLKLQAVLGDIPDPAWQDDLEQLTIPRWM